MCFTVPCEEDCAREAASRGAENDEVALAAIWPTRKTLPSLPLSSSVSMEAEEDEGGSGRRLT